MANAPGNICMYFYAGRGSPDRSSFSTLCPHLLHSCNLPLVDGEHDHKPYVSVLCGCFTDRHSFGNSVRWPLFLNLRLSLDWLPGGRYPTVRSSHPPVVQISLDLIDIREALETARIAAEAGVDWLEAGTPLILAEGLHGVRAFRAAFPNHPIVADLKTMDGGYLEAEMMAKAGATHVVVMARAHAETIKVAVKAGRDYGIKIMGDNLGCEDKVAASRMMEDLGVDYIVHHTGD